MPERPSGNPGAASALVDADSVALAEVRWRPLARTVIADIARRTRRRPALRDWRRWLALPGDRPLAGRSAESPSTATRGSDICGLPRGVTGGLATALVPYRWEGHQRCQAGRRQKGCPAGLA